MEIIKGERNPEKKTNRGDAAERLNSQVMVGSGDHYGTDYIISYTTKQLKLQTIIET